MKERVGCKLPCQQNGEDVYLPDFVTLAWMSPTNGECEIECHPGNVEEFKLNQEKIEGKVIWRP
jgi:hypothetical protein